MRGGDGRDDGGRGGDGGTKWKEGWKNTLVVFFLSMNSLGSFLFCLNPLLSQKNLFLDQLV